ncbi:MAG: ribosome maturation factor RimM [Balneolaceae bacterium]
MKPEPDFQSRFTEIGRLGKPRGLHGVCRFLPNPTVDVDHVQTLTIVFLKNERGDLTPARIESIHTEEKRNQQMFFVKLDTITDRTEAEQAVDSAIFTDQPVTKRPDSASDADDLIGYDVYYNGARFGEVVGVMSTPAHPIYEVRSSVGLVLIPAVPEYIETTNEEKRTLYCVQLHQLIEELE